jgi:hypothetical protein
VFLLRYLDASQALRFQSVAKTKSGCSSNAKSNRFKQAEIYHQR